MLAWMGNRELCGMDVYMFRGQGRDAVVAVSGFRSLFGMKAKKFGF